VFRNRNFRIEFDVALRGRKNARNPNVA